MFMYSVYDKAAGSFNIPFFQLNDRVAIRSFMDLVRDERSQVSKHPEDYDLWCLGSFDDASGLISVKFTQNDEQVDYHRRLCSGLDFIREAEHANS